MTRTPPSSTAMPSRRRLLAALGGSALAAAAGCLGGIGDPDAGGRTPMTGVGDCSRPPDSKTSTTTTTTTERTTTYGTGGPDERVDTRPPVAPALPAEGHWPEFRFDRGNTATNPDGTGLRDAEGYWRIAGGGPPAVAGGTMFNVFGRDREKRAFARRDPTTAGPCSMTPLVGYGVNPEPVVRSDRAFVTTFIEVFCLATDRDEVLWRGPEMDGIQVPPAASEDGVFVNSGGFKGVSPQLRAFDHDGTERWTYDTGRASRSTPALADGAVFVMARDGLHAVDAGSGDRRWHSPADGNWWTWTTPVAAGDAVYVPVQRDGADELVAVETADGTVRWRVETDAGDHPPVVAPGDGEVYTTQGGRLVALDAADGSRLRTFEGDARPLARAGDVLYGARDGVVHAYDVGGDRLWKYATLEVTIEDTVGRRVYGVTPVDGAVYVSARDAFHGIGPAEG